MRNYEIIVALFSGARKIGSICVHARAKSCFEAAVNAERMAEGSYGADVYGAARKVREIGRTEYNAALAA